MKKEGGNMQEVLDFWFKEITPSDWFKKMRHLTKKYDNGFKNIRTSETRGTL